MSKSYVFLKDIDTSAMPEDRREAWMPKGGHYFDPVMRETFDSRKQKRAFMRHAGLRECGELINPNKHILGREKSRPASQREAIARYIASRGGTEGLLKRVQERRGNFL